MSRTTTLRRQHDMLLSLADELRDMSGKLITREDAISVCRTLAKMTGLLRMHLVIEDRSLYPSMMACGDTSVVDLATRFNDEMGGLGEAYFAFVDKWKPSIVLEHSGEFNKEYLEIFAALTSRIERENNELYPAADTMPYIRN